MAALAVLAAASASIAECADERATIVNDPTGFSILEAEEKVMYNEGPAMGDVTSEADGSLKKDVIKFDYTILPGGLIGPVIKKYPPKFKADVVDAFMAAARVSTPEQLGQISIRLEVKGDRPSAQVVSLPVSTGWNYIREPVDWNRIGELKEVVILIIPRDMSKKLEGIIYFDLNFYKMSLFQKNIIFVKAAAAAALAALLALIAALLGMIFRPRVVCTRNEVMREIAKLSSSPATLLTRLARDVLYGIVAMLIAAVALFVYSQGFAPSLQATTSFGFLGAGLAGAAIAELLKRGLTGRHLTPAETFQNTLFTGLLAVASSKLGVLAAPSSWMQLLMFSNWVATITVVVYHAANARSIASSGRHLKAASAAFIFAAPYIFNWLLLLESVGLLKVLGGTISAGLLAAWPHITEFIGRIIVMFVFNEIVMNGIGLVTKSRLLKAPKAHLSIFLVSLGAVVAPVIANLGSVAFVAKLPIGLRAITAIVTTMLSYGGLWAEVYLITGGLLDGGHSVAPTAETISKHVNAGMKKGMAYSAILVAIMYALYMIVSWPVAQKIMGGMPILIGIVCGALIFPLLKTIIETFDGSLKFFERAQYSYSDGSLYARGVVVGFGFAFALTRGMVQWPMGHRCLFGLIIGVLSSGGVSFLRDAVWAMKRQGKIQTWRLYFVDSCLGAFLGSAMAFYLDTLQVPVIVEKFNLYVSTVLAPARLNQYNAATFSSEGFYNTWPLVMKWGHMDLGQCTGGAKLLFLESLAGVINWSIAAWLFAINKVFMQAYFEKDKTPIKFFFSKAGFAQLVEHMIYVLRWGLWMSPIIFTFLRMMPDPTWYNQDGMIHTFTCIFNNFAMTPEAFRQWSLQVFVWVLAFDWFRVLIWMDHMGLRVATLVNLSFLGMDRLDERIGRFIGKASAQRYIPEGVKRFATWAPLLIPFYLPRGKDWDYAWTTSGAIQEAARGKGIVPALQAMSPGQVAILIIVALLVCIAASFILRTLSLRNRKCRLASYELCNREYKTIVREDGAGYSELTGKECDITRRSYDTVDPCGRIIFVVDTAQSASSPKRFWPVVGNCPAEKFAPSIVEQCDGSLKVINSANGILTTVEISLPDQDATAEIWKIKIENLTDKPRALKVVPYLEWVLNGGLHDRFHTQYQRLYPEMGYDSSVNAIVSSQKSTKSTGVLASDVAPEGFSTSRFDFIGRARSIWSPRILETLDFLSPRDTDEYPTFDPIGSLMLNAAVGAKGSVTMQLLIGYAKNKEKAVELAKKYIKAQVPKTPPPEKKKRALLIGHGEIPLGTPVPYSDFTKDGNTLVVKTPFTPRPIDHAVSNAIHSVMVTNRGLHTSCNGNSQQNRLTPDWADMVTREIPSEAIYLYDRDTNEWYSPTYHPLNKPGAAHECAFSVDGSAVFRMTDGTISTELAVFVPPDEPTGVYLLTIKNSADHPRKMRVAPYFQMVLGFMPEKSGPLPTRYDKKLDALFYENPRNIFRSGPAFVSMSVQSESHEIRRGRFFGTGRTVARPYMVEMGSPDATQLTDDGQVAAFLATLEVPARGQASVAIILGQTDRMKEAVGIIKKYKDIEAAKKSLADTRRWWLGLMETVKVETSSPEFDRYQNWLKYQALAERIWARRGFYQTSGAYGFRDQLQDTINLIWVDPALARTHIVLAASQQFLEGDVFHWFFTLTDGRMAFSCRTHASDNPVWLAWGVAEYIRMTGDRSILDEMTFYAYSEFPFAKLPKNKQGWGHLYHRTTRSDTVYRHCMRSIDLVLNDRMGKHGLPLIQMGDWNDGLDEIGSEGRGESIWLGFFLHYILKGMADCIGRKDGAARKEHYVKRMKLLEEALEKTWRGDRYLRAIHDDGTEIGMKGSGIWEIDALTASWAVTSGINFERGLTIFNTALKILEKDNAILLGWPALREDTKPYLGRSSKYPEGVRENGMYCHGVQWLVRAARLIAEEFERRGDRAKADEYRATAYRLWLKISPIPHVKGPEQEIYGGQPNKQSADMLTNFEPGRMIWHGYTGAAGWMLRQAMEGVVGATLAGNELHLPSDLDKPRGDLKIKAVRRDINKSPLAGIKVR